MNLLLAEDNQDHRDLFELLLHSAEKDCRITSVSSGSEFVQRLSSGEFDLGVLDYHLPDGDATAILPHADHIPGCPPIIVVSSDDASDTIITALRSGGRDFLPKSEAFDAARLLARIREVLKRRRNEAQLIERQKDEGIAVLAGGIAHDFNNILVGVLGNAALLRETLPTIGRQSNLCDGIVIAAERLAGLAKQLLAYARGGKYQPRPLDVNDVIRDSLAMLQGVIGGETRVETALDRNLSVVEADHGQLVQVMMNLCLNAQEAMGGHGRLEIRTENIERLEAWQCALAETHPAGSYVRIAVTDDGPGIPAAVVARMFSPYFSTKGPGRGLGLAAVSGIVRNHHGGVVVRTSEGVGSTIEVLLPIGRAGGASVCGSASASASSDAPAGEIKRGSVLVVEDDEDVRDIVLDILQDAGFDVAAVSTAAEARRMLADYSWEVDVLLVDLRLPDGSGSDICRTCRSMRPAARIVVCSGYDRAEAVNGLLTELRDVPFLQKPFKPAELLRVVGAASPA